ncbi:hypothetical protein [Lacticaseibacillus kribbianus]|uniref:hypothetical protein n=1 Tax=Lacticaseibacillus kribbianus TaxID=2926292 RepID=UPI001CD54240|nr:hypothetical protein [Lacticaseibacillus kribbianus]
MKNIIVLVLTALSITVAGAPATVHANTTQPQIQHAAEEAYSTTVTVAESLVNGDHYSATITYHTSFKILRPRDTATMRYWIFEVDGVEVDGQTLVI